MSSSDLVTIINAYREELISNNYSDEILDALIKELEPENLPKQYFFGTTHAIKMLHFKKVKREVVG